LNPRGLDSIYLPKTLRGALCHRTIGNFHEIKRRHQCLRLSWMNRHERDSQFIGNLAYCIGSRRARGATRDT
jgi:hypothetical protein